MTEIRKICYFYEPETKDDVYAMNDAIFEFLTDEEEPFIDINKYPDPDSLFDGEYVWECTYEGYRTSMYFDRSFGNWLPGDYDPPEFELNERVLARLEELELKGELFTSDEDEEIEGSIEAA